MNTLPTITTNAIAAAAAAAAAAALVGTDRLSRMLAMLMVTLHCRGQLYSHILNARNELQKCNTFVGVMAFTKLLFPLGAASAGVGSVRNCEYDSPALSPLCVFEGTVQREGRVK